MCGGAGMLSLHCACAVALQHVPPMPVTANTLIYRIRIVIGKCLVRSRISS
jgi:hypothetical protein